MSMKETIIENLDLVEIKKGETVRKGQTFYTFDFYEGMSEYEGMSRVTVEKNIASEDFKVVLYGYYRESINIDDLNPGSLVRSSGELYFLAESFGVKWFVGCDRCTYSEVEIDEVIYYA